MANPYTKFLSADLDDNSLSSFISYWDRLESLVVSVYRNSVADREHAREFEQVWAWLGEDYPNWRSALRPYWGQAKAGGQPVEEDPFARILNVKSAADLAGDWSLMQQLPAAREALNRFVLDQTDK
jgi:hypothetical protein